MKAAKWLTRVGVYVSICLVATVAFAQKTKTVESRVTAVALSDSLTGALTSLGVTPGGVAPSRLHNGVAFFPIVGGAVDLDTAAGNIVHSGGLTLTAGGPEVRLVTDIAWETSEERAGLGKSDAAKVEMR